MKKIIEVLILIGGLMMVVSCTNPSSVSDDTYSQNTNTEVQNGSDNGNGNGTTDNPNGGTTDPQNTNIINGTYISNTRKFTLPIENVNIISNNVSVNNHAVSVKCYSKSNRTSSVYSKEVWNKDTDIGDFIFSTNYNSNVVTIEFTKPSIISTISSFECSYDVTNYILRIYY